MWTSPKVWLDNSATARALRAPILGRKNHYGSKSKRGMKAAAVLYSLVEYLREAVYRLKANPGTTFFAARDARSGVGPELSDEK